MACFQSSLRFDLPMVHFLLVLQVVDVSHHLCNVEEIPPKSHHLWWKDRWDTVSKIDLKIHLSVFEEDVIGGLRRCSLSIGSLWCKTRFVDILPRRIRHHWVVEKILEMAQIFNHPLVITEGYKRFLFSLVLPFASRFEGFQSELVALGAALEDEKAWKRSQCIG